MFFSILSINSFVSFQNFSSNLKSFVQPCSSRFWDPLIIYAIIIREMFDWGATLFIIKRFYINWVPGCSISMTTSLKLYLFGRPLTWPSRTSYFPSTRFVFLLLQSLKFAMWYIEAEANVTFCWPSPIVIWYMLY